MQSLPKIKIVAVGKIKKGWIQDGIKVYSKRLPELDIIEIKDSGKGSEATKVQSLLKTHDKLIALSEEGLSFDSTKFSQWIAQEATGTLVFFIGGPEGISKDLRQKAHLVLSLSAMTFPHEVARLMLVEQLYRTKTIFQGSSYHK